MAQYTACALPPMAAPARRAPRTGPYASGARSPRVQRPPLQGMALQRQRQRRPAPSNKGPTLSRIPCVFVDALIMDRIQESAAALANGWPPPCYSIMEHRPTHVQSKPMYPYSQPSGILEFVG